VKQVIHDLLMPGPDERTTIEGLEQLVMPEPVPEVVEIM